MPVEPPSRQRALLWGVYYTRCDQTARANCQIHLQRWDSVCLEDGVTSLALMKCLDCGATRHRIVPEDRIIECTACGSDNVVYPYNPTY